MLENTKKERNYISNCYFWNKIKEKIYKVIIANNLGNPYL
jgi:hypothetical protein